MDQFGIEIAGNIDLPFLILNLRLHIIDGIGRLYLESDGLASEGLNEDLHNAEDAIDLLDETAR